MTRPQAPLVRMQGVADELPAQLLGLLAGIYVSGVLALYAEAPIGVGTAWLGVLAGLVLPSLFFSGSGRRWPSVVLTGGVLIGALFFANAFFDGSSDAIGYHKPGVLQLLGGWNPYWSASSGPDLAYWSVVYPKASWICGAQLTSLTGRLECSKAINVIALVTAGFAAWRFLRHRLPQHPRIAILASALIALNPVVVAQSATFYIDGLLASLLTVLLFNLASLVAGERRRFQQFEIAVCAVLLTNLKFTGAVYVGLAFFLAGLVLWRVEGFKSAGRLAGTSAFTLLVALLCFGKTPYFDNLAEGRHLFHPLMGAAKVDFMPDFRPAQISNLDRFTRFAVVNLAKRSDPSGELVPRWPFQFEPFDERLPDSMIGAFGPFYAEAVLLAALTLGLLAMRKMTAFHFAGGYLLVAVVVTGFCHADAWWARYSPQLFLLPVLAAVVALKTEDSRLLRVGHTMLLVLVLNVIVVAFNAWGRSAWVTYRLNQDIAVMRAAGGPERPIEINFGQFRPLSRRLQEAGVYFIEAPAADTTGWNSVYSTFSCFWRKSPAHPQP